MLLKHIFGCNGAGFCKWICWGLPPIPPFPHRPPPYTARTRWTTVYSWPFCFGPICSGSLFGAWTVNKSIVSSPKRGAVTNQTRQAVAPDGCVMAFWGHWVGRTLDHCAKTCLDRFVKAPFCGEDLTDLLTMCGSLNRLHTFRS
jgi:hypothetical protein